MLNCSLLVAYDDFSSVIQLQKVSFFFVGNSTLDQERGIEF